MSAENGNDVKCKKDIVKRYRQQLELFGNTGHCSACNKIIPAFEMVMRAKDNVYHLECFACQQCSHRFCVGDKFYLCNNKILCEYDYEERMVFASLAFNPGVAAHIRRSSSTSQFDAPNLSQNQRSALPPCSSSSSNVLTESPVKMAPPVVSPRSSPHASSHSTLQH